MPLQSEEFEEAWSRLTRAETFTGNDTILSLAADGVRSRFRDVLDSVRQFERIKKGVVRFWSRLARGNRFPRDVLDAARQAFEEELAKQADDNVPKPPISI